MFDGIWIPRPRDVNEAMYILDRYSYNATAAFALEFIFPSAGLFYTRRFTEAGIYWAGTLIGVVTLVSGVLGNVEGPMTTTDSAQLVAGMVLVGGLRIGAMVYAPWFALEHETQLRTQLGLGFDNWHSFRPPSAAESPILRAASVNYAQSLGNRIELPLLSLSF